MPVLDIFWAILMISVFFAWLMLLFRVFADILRSQDMGGGSKALWALVVVILPLLGVLVYVAIRGKGMRERSVQDAYRVAGHGSTPGNLHQAQTTAYINTQGM